MDDGGGLPYGRQHDYEWLRRQHRFPAGTAGTDRGGTRRDRRRGAGISRGGDWSGVPTFAGIGTIITAFFMGPLIEFFCEKIARPMLGK